MYVHLLGILLNLYFSLFLPLLGCHNTLKERCTSDKAKINYRLFPRGQGFSLGIRLTTFTILVRIHSKEKLFSFLLVFPVRHYFGIWVSSVSQIMCLHSPTKKRQLVSFRSLKNYHVFAILPFIPPLTHTWLIESGVLSWPCHLVLIGRVKEKRPFHFHYSWLLL